MKNTIKIAAITSFMLFIGCSDKRTGIQESEIIIDETSIVIKPVISTSYEQFDILPILDSIKYVKLELTEESIIGYIQKVQIFEERIYILDTQTSSLLVFDLEGKYLFKIANMGMGPKEYIQLDFFDIDHDKKEIVLTDLMGYWIMRYDMEGNYIARSKIPFWGEGIAPIHNRDIVLCANYRYNQDNLSQEYNIMYLDSTMSLKNAFFPYNSSLLEKTQFSSPQSGFFYFYDNETHFFDPFGNKVYQVKEEGLVQKYVFDFGDKTFDPNYLSEPAKLGHYLDRIDFYRLYSVIENNQFLTFTIMPPPVSPLCIGFYCKRTGNTLSSYSFRMGENDYLLGSDVVTTHGSWIVAQIQTEDLVDKKESYKKMSKKTKYTEDRDHFINGLTIDDNPVLMFYKLKDF